MVHTLKGVFPGCQSHYFRLGFIHMRDRESAFPCFLPGRYWMLKLYWDNISVHRAMRSFGSLRLNSQTKAWWSVLVNIVYSTK